MENGVTCGVEVGFSGRRKTRFKAKGIIGSFFCEQGFWKVFEKLVFEYSVIFCKRSRVKKNDRLQGVGKRGGMVEGREGKEEKFH